MKLNQDRVPSSVLRAVFDIVTALEPDEVSTILTTNPSDHHSSVGMHIRNSWSLWEEDTPLKRDFQKQYGLWGHADDISGLLLEALWARVNKEDEVKRMNTCADRFKRHWTTYNIDYKTGKQLT